MAENDLSRIISEAVTLALRQANSFGSNPTAAVTPNAGQNNDNQLQFSM